MYFKKLVYTYLHYFWNIKGNTYIKMKKISLYVNFFLLWHNIFFLLKSYHRIRSIFFRYPILYELQFPFNTPLDRCFLKELCVSERRLELSAVSIGSMQCKSEINREYMNKEGDRVLSLTFLFLIFYYLIFSLLTVRKNKMIVFTEEYLIIFPTVIISIFIIHINLYNLEIWKELI